MIGARIEIQGTLEVLTPLVIGTGKRVPVVTDHGESTKATVVRAKGEKPYIPGASLKGVLRRLVEDGENLFGPAEISETTPGESGLAIFWDSYQIGDDACIETESRTSIDGDTGTAAAGRLFTEEYVKPGAEFAFELFLAEAAPRSRPDDREVLQRLLGRMMAEEGIPLGADTRQGKGRVKLKAKGLEVFTKEPGAPKLPVQLAVVPQAGEAQNGLFKLRLTCDGPFLILDNARSKERTSKEDAHLLALMDFDGEGPRLTGSTLIGALRAAFAWHMADEDVDHVIEDRLFGTTDWRGLVEIARLDRVGTPKKQSIPSVKIDRFSGAPMDNALFFTEGWTGVAFDLALRLASRKGMKSAEETELKQVFETFLNRLKDEHWGGLELGHGGNRGYGWFSVADQPEKGERHE